MYRIVILVAELALVAIAVFAADLLQRQIEFIPGWLVHLPQVDYGPTDFWITFTYFLVGHLLVFTVAQVMVGPWRPSESRRSVDELFALAAGFALSALTLFITSSVAFDPQFVVGIAVCSALLVLTVHLVAAVRTNGAVQAIRASAFALLRRTFSVPGVLILAFAVSPGILAKLFVSDRDIANAITQVRIYMADLGAEDAQWSTRNALNGRTFLQPIQVRFPPHRPDRLYVLERGGRLHRMPWRAPGESALVLDIAHRVGVVEVENGALGFDFHPAFGSPDSADRGSIFLYYTDVRDGRQVNRLSKFDLNAPEPAATEQPLIVWDRNASGFHNGGEVRFGPDGFLYLGIGEMSDGDSHQAIDHNLAGGVLRIDADRQGGDTSHPPPRQPADGTTRGYYIPSDNPFVGQETVLEEFWALGLRNPFRMSFDSATGRLWAGEVGSTVWEEVNLLEAGGNYQFPFIEGYEATGEARPEVVKGREQPPVHTYRHTSFDRAVIGGVVYRGERFPELQGLYVFGDNYSGKIFAFPATGERIEEAPVLGQVNQYAQRGLTSFTETPDGEILITTLGQADRATGEVLQLVRGASEEGEAAAAPPDQQGAVTMAAALTLYRTNCSRCHGENGMGDAPDAAAMDVPMPDFTSAAFQDQRTDAQLRGVIVDGGAPHGLSAMMPPWGRVLSDAEVDAMVRVVRDFGQTSSERSD